LAPIMPFITDYLWRQLYGSSSIHLELIPKPNPVWDTDYARVFSKVMEVNHGIWSYKKSRGMKLSEPLNAVLYIPSDIEVFAKDLKHLHKIAEIRTGIPSIGNAIEIAKEVYLVVL